MQGQFLVVPTGLVGRSVAETTPVPMYLNMPGLPTCLLGVQFRSSFIVGKAKEMHEMAITQIAWIRSTDAATDAILAYAGRELANYVRRLCGKKCELLSDIFF